MRYYTFSLREDINYHECHINIALIFIFPCSQKIEKLRYNQAKKTGILGRFGVKWAEFS